VADTVNVPVAGSVPKNAVLVALGVGGALLGYSWYKKRQAAQPVTAVGNVNDLVGATQYTGSPNVAGATGNATVTGGALSKNQIQTNGDWTQAAVAYLEQNGSYDPTALMTALGKYLANQPVTTNEAGMIMAARAAFGDPPVGGPYTLHLSAVATPEPVPGQGPGLGPGATNDFPGTGEQQLGPPPGAVPHVWETQPGDTLLNLVPRLYATDTLQNEPDPTRNVNPPTELNRAHREAVAHAIYLSNMFTIPSDINAPLPPGRFITYY
jgi:hypothetical protein